MAAASAPRALETSTRAAGVADSEGERVATRSTLKSKSTTSPSPSSTSLPPSVLEAAASDFASRGLAVVPSFLSGEELEALREECGSVVLDAARREGTGTGATRVSEFLVASAGCVVQTLPRGSAGSLAAASGDAPAASAARRSSPCTRRGAEIALGQKLASFARALLVAAADEDKDEDENEKDASEKASTSTSNHQPLVLIGEQYIVKPPRGGPRTAFAWHADGAWLEAGMSEACPEEPRERRRETKTTEAMSTTTATATTESENKESSNKRCRLRRRREQTYLSVWITLDDVGHGNGGLVLPGEDEIEELAERERERRKRRRRRRKGLREDDDEREDVVGEENLDSCPSSSCPLVAPAGTAVAMASWLRHASGPNDSAAARRAWMPQLKLGPVEVAVDVGVDDDGNDDGQDDDSNRQASSSAAGAAGAFNAARAAARETWRVPVPCVGLAP